MSLRVWRHLHVRAAMVAIPLLALLALAMVAMLHHYSAQTAIEASQRMNLGLADYIVEHQAPGLIAADGQADRGRMKELAHHVMMINPAVEVYLLDADGRVLAHALEGLQGLDPVGRVVDMAPVQRLLEARRNGEMRLDPGQRPAQRRPHEYLLGGAGGFGRTDGLPLCGAQRQCRAGLVGQPGQFGSPARHGRGPGAGDRAGCRGAVDCMAETDPAATPPDA